MNNSNRIIPLARPDIQERDIEAVVTVLRTGMLVQGECVAAFEKDVANYLGVKHACCASNGTATLHMALIALGIKPGDEVIVPAFSYIATANVIELVGAKPIFVDIDLATFNINTKLLHLAITPQTKAIIPVHEFGLAADIIEIQEFAKKHNLYIIEDAACALGAMEIGRPVGTFGQFASFSLHPRKAISSGEGGILTTDDDDLAEEIRILRNHGIKIENGKMQFIQAGFNYRMTDFQAALVHSQFKRLDSIISYKNELASIYINELDTQKLFLPMIPHNKNHTWQTFHVVLSSGIQRDVLIQQLKSYGISTNYGAQCIPAQEYYKKKYGLDFERHFPVAFQAYQNGLALPIYERLNPEDVKYVCKTLNKLIKEQ